MGDDAVACRVVDRLAVDPSMQRVADLLAGETEVLRLADHFKGRRRVFVIDAVLDDAPPGTVSAVDAFPLAAADCGSRHAHGITPVDTLGLLRAVNLLAPSTALTFLTISIGSARVDEVLSPALSQALPAIVNRVRELIANSS
jgi:hydrogenase maturation protease